MFNQYINFTQFEIVIIQNRILVLNHIIRIIFYIIHYRMNIFLFHD